MKKNYITPFIKVKEIGGYALMQDAASINGSTPTRGLDDGSGSTKEPGVGGDNDGSHTVGSKRNVFEDGFSSVWE